MPPKPQASRPTLAPTSQYQHYIPRFILRKFLETQGPPRTAKQRSKENWKAKKKGIETELLNVYDLSTKTFQSLSISKSFGEINLYTDLANGINHQHVEEKLSRLENEAAQVVTAIQDARGQGTFTLTRRSLEVLRKFVFVMHYRKPNIQASYFKEDRDGALKDWLEHYMQKHNLKTREDVWLHGLAYILDTPHPDIVSKGEQIYAQYGELRLLEMMSTRIDPKLENWFAVDYRSMANSHYLGVWQAAPGCEFILGNNCFGLWEGLLNGMPGTHRIFIISPTLAIVLRSNLLREEVRSGMPAFTHSALTDVEMPSPETHYQIPFSPDDMERFRKYRATPLAQKDTFNYSISKLTEVQTREVNEVILLNVPRDGALVFLSKEHALRAARYHIASPDPVVQSEGPSEKFRPLLLALEGIIGPQGGGMTAECDADFRFRVVLEIFRRRLDRFPSEWDAAYWCYRTMTADPNQTHPLILDMRARLTQLKLFFSFAPGRSPSNPTARISDHLNEEDSNRVLGRMSTLLQRMMGYPRTKIRTDAAFVRVGNGRID